MRRTQSAIDWIRLILFSTLLLAIPVFASGQEEAGATEASGGDPAPGDAGEEAVAGDLGSDGKVDPKESSTPHLVRTTQHLLRQIEALRAEIRDLDQDLERAVGEDKPVLRFGQARIGEQVETDSQSIGRLRREKR